MAPIPNRVKGNPTHGHRTQAEKQRHLAPVSTIPGPVSAASSPVSSIPLRAPRDLAPEGRAAWRMAVKSAPWLRTEIDGLLLRRWCELHAESAELRREIGEHGRTSAGSKGQLVESPGVGMLRSVDEQALRLASVLGLGPLHAARLGVAVAALPEEPDKLTELLARWAGAA
jgi:P27 family predicted phage terminase small subunit